MPPTKTIAFPLHAAPHLFAIRLRTIRQQKGLTQADLGKLADMHQRSISQFESGQHNPTLGTVIRLARALGVSADALIPS